ncbi:MAG: hypothetical protein AAB368_17145, partial [bacterium]
MALLCERALGDSLSMHRIPPSFGIEGMEWRPLHLAFMVDAAGATQEWFPSDYIVFMPEPSMDWWEVQEGSYEVPTNIAPVSGVEAALANFATVQGMFS